MICPNCGKQDAYVVRSGIDEKTKKWWDLCDGCGGITPTPVPDVSMPGGRYFDEHLCDKENPQGQWVESKRHKKQLLNKLDLKEVGDRINPTLGRPMPHIKDTKQRQKFMKDNFK